MTLPPLTNNLTTPVSTMLSSSRWVRLIALALLVSLAVACTIPSDDEANVVTVGDDHLGVLDPAPTPESTTTTVSERTKEVGLYFIEDDKLQRLTLDLAVSQAENLTSVLNELLQGTLRQNFRSAIPPGVEIIDTRVDRTSRTATVVLLNDTFFAIEGRDRYRAIAQVVFTATDRNGNAFGVDSIQFEIDGNLVTIPRGDGTDTNQPVGRCDYADFADFVEPVRDCPSTVSSTTTSTTPPASDEMGD